MTELEQLKLDRSSINIKIQDLEKSLLPKYNYTEYENKYFRYCGTFIYLKKWTGGILYENHTCFDYICIEECCIQYIEDTFINMTEIYEITQDIYEIEFNKVLNKLK